MKMKAHYERRKDVVDQEAELAYEAPSEKSFQNLKVEPRRVGDSASPVCGCRGTVQIEEGLHIDSKKTIVEELNSAVFTMQP
jgi:hypothetical protein